MNAPKFNSNGTLAEIAKQIVRVDDPRLDPAGSKREEALVDAVFVGRADTMADAFAQLVACLDFAHGIVDYEASYAEEHGPKLVRALYSVIGAIEANTGWRREEFGGYPDQPARLRNLIKAWHDREAAIEATKDLSPPLPMGVDDALMVMVHGTIAEVADVPAESAEDVALKLRFFREAFTSGDKCDNEALGDYVASLAQEAEALAAGGAS